MIYENQHISEFVLAAILSNPISLSFVWLISRNDVHNPRCPYRDRCPLPRDPERGSHRIPNFLFTSCGHHLANMNEQAGDPLPYEQAIDSLSEGVIFTDPNQPDNPIVYANQAFLYMTGYTREEVLGRNCRFLQGDETDPETRRKIREAIDEERSITTEILNYRKNGTAFWNELTINPVHGDGGELIRYIGIQRNVTEEKRMEKELRHSERQFRKMAETIDQGFFYVTSDYPDYEWLYVNPAFERLFKVTLDELQAEPMAWSYQIPRGDFQDLQDDLKAHKTGDLPGPQTQEFRVDHPGEPVCWLRVKIYPIRSEGEVTHLFGTATDITARKRYRDQMEESQRQFQEIAQAVDETFWLASKDRETLYYLSPGFEETWGISLETMYSDPTQWKTVVVDEDRARIESELEQNLPGPLHLEFRIEPSQGDRKWIRCEGFPVYDEDGDIYRYAALTQDVTNRKQLEERLRESLEEKTTLIQEIHHRVKNNLQIISSILGLEQRQEHDRSTDQILRDAQHRIQAMAQVHESLYRGEPLNKVHLCKYLEDITRELTKMLTPEDRFESLSVSRLDEPLHLDLERAVPLGLVVNELVSNALKHGSNGHSLSLEVDLWRANDQLHLNVADNGSGLPDSVDPTDPDSLGLQLVQSLAEDQLCGSVNVREEDGTHFTVKIPETVLTGED